MYLLLLCFNPNIHGECISYVNFYLDLFIVFKKLWPTEQAEPVNTTRC